MSTGKCRLFTRDESGSSEPPVATAAMVLVHSSKYASKRRPLQWSVSLESDKHSWRVTSIHKEHLMISLMSD